MLQDQTVTNRQHYNIYLTIHMLKYTHQAEDTDQEVAEPGCAVDNQKTA